MSENKDNKLTLINEKTANDYLTHTTVNILLTKDIYHATISVEMRCRDARGNIDGNKFTTAIR